MVGFDVLHAIKMVLGQTEVMLFVIAVLAHQFFFSRLRIPKNQKAGIKSTRGPAPARSKSPKGHDVSPRADGEQKKAGAEDRNPVMLIKAAANKRQLQEAVAIFRSCPRKSAVHYNALLDACVSCGDTTMADQVLSDAIDAKAADTTTFNTIMKVHLQAGDVRRARRAIVDMTAAGFKANTVTYNELLDATVSRNTEASWQIVDEMTAANVKPNHITCSILLKSVQPNTSGRGLLKALELVDALDEPMDEVLLSSVIEACIRASRTDLLRSVLRRQSTGQRVRVQSCHAYGSLIRAYGVMQDIDAVWATWRELRSRRVELTSITLGCMVEAVVTNSSPDGGYELICEVLADAQVKPLVNAIMYGSILKGYSHLKQFDRVWTVYQEMKKNCIDPTLTTYNTLIDACARCNEMGRVSGLLMEMSSKGIQLNIITYSAIIKGYCQENRVDQALEVLKEMRASPSLRPDEHTYNTVINGCARQGLYDQGVAILQEMCKAGIKPTNFTLSVLVKLASRSRKVDKAFEMCDNLSKKYHFRLNVHVYNNLIQACITNKALRRAFEVVERMVQQRVALDARTYTLLLRGCVEAGAAKDAAGLLRAAIGAKGEHPCVQGATASVLQPKGSLPSELVVETLDGIKIRCRDPVLSAQVLQDLQTCGYKLDARSKLRLMSS